MLRNIAVGVDGTPASLAAAHWAAEEAERRETGLSIVHAWRGHPRPGPNIPLGRTEREWAEQTLLEAVGSVRAAHPGLRIDEHLVCEATVAALVAPALKADVLVLGSLGLGALGGFVTGSVSQRVVARSERPVVLVRARRSAADEHLPAVDGVAPEEIPRTPYRAVVLGLDVGHPCDELIAFAFDAARRRETGLRVVHTFTMPSRPVSDPSETAGPVASPPPAPGPETQAAEERAVAAALRPWRDKYPTVSVTEAVTEGRAAPALVHATKDAGLLVVGRRTSGNRPGAHTGPVTHAVLHHVGCPVVVVPHD
ncbi:universal stress protein [Streptomyces sp. NPDC048484]|uniref:universal stress protein n=1 Tax=Streptomyces sp. NPDC048484 TaxID=3155146 RepID=UPI003442FEE3